MSDKTHAAQAGAAMPACTTCAHAHAPLPDGWAALDFFDRRAMVALREFLRRGIALCKLFINPAQSFRVIAWCACPKSKE